VPNCGVPGTAELPELVSPELVVQRLLPVRLHSTAGHDGLRKSLTVFGTSKSVRRILRPHVAQLEVSATHEAPRMTKRAAMKTSILPIIIENSATILPILTIKKAIDTVVVLLVISDILRPTKKILAIHRR
jgi:hypothetical protein